MTPTSTQLDQPDLLQNIEPPCTQARRGWCVSSRKWDVLKWMSYSSNALCGGDRSIGFDTSDTSHRFQTGSGTQTQPNTPKLTRSTRSGMHFDEKNKSSRASRIHFHRLSRTKHSGQRWAVRVPLQIKYPQTLEDPCCSLPFPPNE